MKIKFVDRGTAKRLIRDGYFDRNICDFISISDTNSEATEMRELWIDNKVDNNAAVFLRFQDIDDLSSGFTEQKAKRIVNFLQESYVKRKDVIVHCFAGISRSGAVAKFANEYWGLGDQYLEDYKGHNIHVYYTLLEAAEVPTQRQYYAELEKELGPDK